jgi:hypothetical protein
MGSPESYTHIWFQIGFDRRMPYLGGQWVDMNEIEIYGSHSYHKMSPPFGHIISFCYAFHPCVEFHFHHMDWFHTCHPNSIQVNEYIFDLRLTSSIWRVDINCIQFVVSSMWWVPFIHSFQFQFHHVTIAFTMAYFIQCNTFVNNIIMIKFFLYCVINFILIGKYCLCHPFIISSMWQFKIPFFIYRRLR